MIEFLDADLPSGPEPKQRSFGTPKPVVIPRRGLIYKARRPGQRLYFSENEIKDIVPRFGYYVLLTTTGGVYEISSSVPDETCFEAPARLSIKGDHYYHRS
jgi:hypothetical protein